MESRLIQEAVLSWVIFLSRGSADTAWFQLKTQVYSSNYVYRVYCDCDGAEGGKAYRKEK